MSTLRSQPIRCPSRQCRSRFVLTWIPRSLFIGRRRGRSVLRRLSKFRCRTCSTLRFGEPSGGTTVSAITRVCGSASRDEARSEAADVRVRARSRERCSQSSTGRTLSSKRCCPPQVSPLPTSAQLPTSSSTGGYRPLCVASPRQLPYGRMHIALYRSPRRLLPLREGARPVGRPQVGISHRGDD